MAAIAAKSIKKKQQEASKLKETLEKQSEVNQLQQEGGLVKRRVGSAKRPTITEQVYRQEAVIFLLKKIKFKAIYILHNKTSLYLRISDVSRY